MTRRQVWRRAPGKDPVVHAEPGDIATFHNNDMLVAPEGDAYIGNFGFDLDAYLLPPSIEHLLNALNTDASPFLGRLAHLQADGTASVAAEQMLFPNGMVLLDEGHTLVVAQTLALELTAFDRVPNGTLSNRRVWASLKEPMVAPNGICADAQGGIWVSNALAPAVLRVEAGGRITDTVTTSQKRLRLRPGWTRGAAPAGVHSAHVRPHRSSGQRQRAPGNRGGLT